MTVSDQIIAVIDKLCEKFGVVIDWGKENVLPYVQDLLARMRIMNIVKYSLAIVGIIIMLTFVAIVIIKAIKHYTNDRYKNKNTFWYDGDEITVCSVLLVVTCVFILMGSALSILIVVPKLMNWIFVPEIEIINYISTLLQ